MARFPEIRTDGDDPQRDDDARAQRGSRDVTHHVVSVRSVASLSASGWVHCAGARSLCVPAPPVPPVPPVPQHGTSSLKSTQLDTSRFSSAAASVESQDGDGCMWAVAGQCTLTYPSCTCTHTLVNPLVYPHHTAAGPRTVSVQHTFPLLFLRPRVFSVRGVFTQAPSASKELTSTSNLRWDGRRTKETP